MNIKKEIAIVRNEPLLLLALPLALISLLLIIAIRPLVRIRIGFLHCDRIGHFAINTELYLCEKELKKNSDKTIDLFYYPRKVCNQQLANMWERRLHVLPWFWLRPLCLIIRKFDLSPYRVYEARGGPRDIDNLLDSVPMQLSFTDAEEIRGETELQLMGIPEGAPFVCLAVRDADYLEEYYKITDTYHSYRDGNIENYILAAKELVDLGYYVIRMGAKVKNSALLDHSMFIDYATNGMRSDFMDIYLSAKCKIFVTTGTGIDCLSLVFRRPIVEINTVPIGSLRTYRKDVIALTKKHVWISSGRELTMSEIFDNGIGLGLSTNYFESMGVKLIERTPEEIRDVVIEMADRLAGTWQAHPDDEGLQQSFWERFPSDQEAQNGKPLHGEIRSRYSTNFLRNNRTWLM
jgi:putative glycosyltransferase (TIGR04372 family)